MVEGSKARRVSQEDLGGSDDYGSLQAQWADHHFDGKKPEDRTFHTFGKPSLDPTGNHALVEFWVEYKHWGYTQLLVLTQQQGKWQLRFAADHRHFTKLPRPSP